jgi:pyruvate dehydrogenase E2 component (dihydrolipoamide acetyltransferase)
MPINVVVPELGPSIEEATLVKWLVAEGDFVREGTPIFSVETDKSVVDCESTDAGYVTRVLASEGATVRVDEVIAILEETVAALHSKPEPDAVSNEAPSPVTENPRPEPSEGSASVPTEPTIAALESVIAEEAVAEGGRMRVSPRARRMARDTGVDVAALRGSGPTGRIVSRDVQAFVAQAVARSGHAGPAPAGPAIGSGEWRDVPLSAMRRTIARRMTESAQSTPVFFATMKIGCEALLALRHQLKQVPGIEPSVTDLIVKACALALRRCPGLNVTFHGEFVRMHHDVDIAVAVAVEDGLVTPLVRRADAKRLVDLSQEIRELAERARAGKLARQEYEGGTFTVSNLGMYGLEEFTAIINPPQCAILAVGAIGKEVVVEAGAPRERRIMKVTLTVDHRAIDGALAARFLAELRTILENPACLVM